MMECPSEGELNALVAQVPDWAQKSAAEKRLLALSPPGGDEYLAAYGHAALMLYATHEQYRDLMESRADGTVRVSERLEDHEVAHKEQVDFRAFQARLLNLFTEYPRTHDDRMQLNTVEGWKNALLMVTDPQFKEHDQFLYDKDFRAVQSNVAQRASIVALLMGLRPDRYRDAIVVDGGCSQQQAGVQLMRQHESSFAFTEWTVMTEPGSMLPATEESKKWVNEHIQKAPRPGMYIGIDPWPINDVANMNWVRACSLRPAEWLDERKVERYRQIEAARENTEGLRFHEADLTQLDTKGFLSEHAIDGADIGLLSAMLYQLDDSARANVVRTMGEIVASRDGALVVFDALTLHPSGRLHVPHYFGRYNHPWTSRAIVQFPARSPEFREFIVSKDGRVTTVALGQYAMHAFLGD